MAEEEGFFLSILILPIRDVLAALGVGEDKALSTAKTLVYGILVILIAYISYKGYKWYRGY